VITIEEARPLYVEGDSAHSFEHVLRVWRLAERIGREEGADLRVLQAAALLHDAGRGEEARTGRCHAEAGADIARRVLVGNSTGDVEAVALAIAEHRYRGDVEPTTVESRVLHDADKLDAIGAIGVARAYAVAGLYGQRLWAPVPADFAERRPADARADLESREHTPVHEYAYKLAKLADRMTTATGRALAAERGAFMRAFFERLEREVSGTA
jgi:uncharacterized protein